MLHDNRNAVIPAWPDRAGFSGVDVLYEPPGSLDIAQRAQLGELSERIRLVHDLGLVLADRYAIFPIQFEGAQTREEAAIRDLTRRYRIADTGEGLPPGRFGNPAVQSDYEKLLRRGNTSRTAALDSLTQALARVIELLDAALPAMRAPDVRHTFTELYAATLRQARTAWEWQPR